MGEGLGEFLGADPQNRSKLFITSKLWGDNHRADLVRQVSSLQHIIYCNSLHLYLQLQLQLHLQLHLRGKLCGTGQSKHNRSSSTLENLPKKEIPRA